MARLGKGLALAITAALLAPGAARTQQPGAAPSEPPEATTTDSTFDMTPAIAAAQSWLGSVDAGRYAESWEASAELFKQTIERPRWEATIVRARGQLGRAESRKLRSANYRRTLPGAPEGEYVVIEFDTRFENRPLTVETVTPVRGRDGAWKVSGYFIR